MPLEPGGAPKGSSARADRTRLITTIAALVCAALAAVVSLRQIDVTTGTGAERSCGSALDATLDRSGWEQWWVADLDESDEDGSASLPRTRQCPAVINTQITLAVVLGSVSIGTIVAGRQLGGGRPRASSPHADADRLHRLGRWTVVAGAIVTLLGLAAMVALVGNADAAMFRHVGRDEVAALGIVALVPAIVLVVIGRAIELLALTLDEKRSDA